MRALSIAASLLLAASPSWALFKVVGADGRVTYTDRPLSADETARVAPFRPGHAAAPEPALPRDLRQAARRYPVTLYAADDCVPCDSARHLLLERGIPFVERRIASEDDARALEQLGAGRLLPGLSIGTQQLRGLDTAAWLTYLDAAGYPRESRLPRGWKPAPASPLAEPRPPAAAAAESSPRPETPATARPSPPPAPPVAPAAAPGFRF